MSENKVTVLCVDDEPRVVSGLERHLRDRYHVLTANSGAEGLDVLNQHADVGIVVSDMRMPAMDGASFLRHARDLRPNAVRLLLTGHADIQAAISAINQGQVFRFLIKPCPPDVLAGTLSEAEQQYHLITAERTLLQRTLVGAIKVLIEIMSWNNPSAIGRAVRLRRRVVTMADAMKVERRWVVETAALFSEIGTLSLPEELADKVVQRLPLDAQELEQVHGAMRAANRLIRQIPRLEPVAELLERTFIAAPEGSAAPADDSLVQLLRLAADLDRIETKGSLPAALALERSRGGYSAEVLDAAEQVAERAKEGASRLMVPVEELRLGMILDEDLSTERGVMIAPQGLEVTESFLEHIRRFAGQLRPGPVAVLRGRATQLSAVA